jgi:hypothetical protein
VAGAVAWGCAVYDSDLVASSGELTGDGASGGAGGGSGSTSSSAGQTAGGGSQAAGGDSGTSTGGSDVSPGDAGAANEGGEGAIVSAGSGGQSGGGIGGTGGTSGSAGKGGSGGVAPVVSCAEHPIPLKTTWMAQASSSSFGDGTEADGLYNPPAHMIDAKYTERWASGKSQSGDEWIEIDFGLVVTLTDLTLNVNNDTGDYPRAYAVRISNKPLDFAAPIKASGAGAPGNTIVHFAVPLTGRYLNVRQTGVNDVGVTAWWTIAEALVGCTDP